MTSRDVSFGMSKKAWWKCPENHEWKAAISSRSRGTGCPYCTRKNEGKVKKLLLNYFKDWIIIPGKKIWNKYKKYNHRRYCDFWLEKNEVKMIVEYDGELHYRPVTFGKISIKEAEEKFKWIQKKDKLDTEFCKENNIILHRIKYDEDKEVSVKKLLLKINNIFN